MAITIEGLLHRVFSERPKHPTLNPEVARFLTNAFTAESEGREEDSRDNFEKAAALAKAIYESAPKVGLTDLDRATLGMHTEIVVSALSSAGDNDEAIMFAGEILANPVLPGISKQRIQKTIELLTGRPQ